MAPDNSFVVLALITAIILLASNLAFCLFERYRPIFRTRRADCLQYAPKRTYILENPEADIDDVLRTMGFRRTFREGGWTVAERGPSHKALTWLFHASLLLSLSGIALTLLFGHDGKVVLKKGETLRFSPENTGVVQSFLGMKDEPGFELTLNVSMADYRQAAELHYPDEFISRLAIGLGWQGLSYGLNEKMPVPGSIVSWLTITEDGHVKAAPAITVNRPFTFNGYSFFQEGLEDVILLQVDDSILPIEARSGEDVIIPGLEVPLRFTNTRGGTVVKLDGSKEEIAPRTTLSLTTDASSPDEGLPIEAGSVLDIEGTLITVVSIGDDAVLGYRFDPGVWPLFFGAAGAVFFIFLRFFGPWYTAAYSFEGGLLLLYISSGSLTSDTVRLIKSFEKNLGGALEIV